MGNSSEDTHAVASQLGLSDDEISCGVNGAVPPTVSFTLSSWLMSILKVHNVPIVLKQNSSRPYHCGVSSVQEILTSDGFSKKWGGCGDEKLHAASLCQGLGADVFRTVKSWAFHESLLRKYCSGSCRNSRMFQGRNMSDRDAAMYTVVAIRRRLTSAVKDPVCACIDCNFPSCGVQPQCDVSEKSGYNLRMIFLCHMVSMKLKL